MYVQYADHDFTVKQIADMMDISFRAVERKLQQFNLQIRAQYSDVSDTDFTNIVLPLLGDNPNLGKVPFVK